MSNYLIAIDPVLLLTDDETDRITNDEKAMENSGSIADAIKETITDKYAFADVFQSTSEKHSIKVHDFLMADKTHQRGMHDIGTLQTKTDLIAYAVVNDDWIEKHPDETKACAKVKLDDRIDPKQLKANDGATKDGRTTGFIRYGEYKTPVMVMVPTSKVNYKYESVKDMEQAADEREQRLRNRKSTFSMIRSAYQMAKQSSTIDAFMVGWNLSNQLRELKNRKNQKNNKNDITTGKSKFTPKDFRNTNESKTNTPKEPIQSNNFDRGLQELSIEQMENNQMDDNLFEQ